MKIKPLVTALAAISLSGGITGALAEAPYYNPANAASSTGLTSGSQLVKTIGCPGRGLLDSACTGKVEPQPAAPTKVAAAKESWLHSFLYVPTGVRETSGLMVERIVPSEVVAGQPFDYKLKVTNLTPSELRDVSVQDACGDNFVLASSEPAPAQSNGNNLQWNIGDMNAKETRDITVRGAFPAGEAAKSCVSANYDQASCQVFNVVEPKLTLAVSAPAEVIRCEPIPVRYVISNPGTGASRQVSLNQQSPKGVATRDGGQMEVNALGDLPAGGSRTVDTVFLASAPGVYAFNPIASANPELKAEASASTKVTQPALEVSKTGKDYILLGRDVAYTVKVTNTGNAVARDVVVEETVPAGAQLANASAGGKLEAGKVVWRLPNLQPQASTEVNFALAVGALGNVESATRVTAYCAEAATANAKTEVKGIPAVLLEVVDLVDPLEIGKDTVYVITATNQGSATDVNLRIKAKLEETMSFVSADGATVGKLANGVVEFDPLPGLAPGATAVWKLTAKALAPSDARFSVEMTSDLRNRPVLETEATNLYK